MSSIGKVGTGEGSMLSLLHPNWATLMGRSCKLAPSGSPQPFSPFPLFSLEGMILATYQHKCRANT